MASSGILEDVDKLQINWNDQKKVFKESMSTFMFNKQFADLTLVCGKQHFSCHRAVLAAASKHFERFLSQVQGYGKEVIILVANVKPDTMTSIMNYMYTGSTNVPYDHLCEFFNTAVQFEIRGIYDNQQQFLAWTSAIESGGVGLTMVANPLEIPSTTPTGKPKKKNPQPDTPYPAKFGVTVVPSEAKPKPTSASKPKTKTPTEKSKAGEKSKSAEKAKPEKAKPAEKNKDKFTPPAKKTISDLPPVLTPNLPTTPLPNILTDLTNNSAPPAPTTEGKKLSRKPRKSKNSPKPAVKLPEADGQTLDSSVQHWLGSGAEGDTSNDQLPLAQIMEEGNVPPGPKRPKFMNPTVPGKINIEPLDPKIDQNLTNIIDQVVKSSLDECEEINTACEDVENHCPVDIVNKFQENDFAMDVEEDDPLHFD